MQAVTELLNCGVNLNARNLEGFTAQDMLQGQTQVNNSVTRDIYTCCGALSYSLRPGILRKTGLIFERLGLLIKSAHEGLRISNDDRNALLVVAALLMTITYQAVITPPGGLWQDDCLPLEGDTGCRYSHRAGVAIAQSAKGFKRVATINFFTFTLSAMMTFLLLPRGSIISALFKMALIQLWSSCFYSVLVISDDGDITLVYSLISSTGSCFVLGFLAFFGRKFWARVKRLRWVFYVVYACIMFVAPFVLQT